MSGSKYVYPWNAAVQAVRKTCIFAFSSLPLSVLCHSTAECSYLNAPINLRASPFANEISFSDRRSSGPMTSNDRVQPIFLVMRALSVYGTLARDRRPLILQVDKAYSSCRTKLTTARDVWQESVTMMTRLSHVVKTENDTRGGLRRMVTRKPEQALG